MSSGYQIADVSKGAFYCNNWCGWAVRKYPHPLDMSIRTEAGVIVPAMPDNPFDHRETVWKMFEAVCQQPGWHRTALVSSLVEEWQANNVPLTPTAALVTKAEHQLAMQTHPDSLEHLYPQQMTEDNPGSKLGLARILREINQKAITDVAPAERKYKTVYADVNIFMTTMGVQAHSSCTTCLPLLIMLMLQQRLPLLIMLMLVQRVAMLRFAHSLSCV